MLDTVSCSACGCMLPVHSPGGRCPACMLSEGLSANLLSDMNQSGETALGQVGGYELLEEIGRGGMGIVYRALQPSLDREVAIKVLRPECSVGPSGGDRFLREARLASGLNHPHICTIHEVGEDPSQGPFIVMEYVKGRTLGALLTDGPLDFERLLAYSRQIAAALAEAHAQGVIHRDIKTDNICVSPTGIVKVLDFGLAASTDGVPLNRTQTGQIMGTPSFMSPEQIRGKRVDARSDIFSLGVVLYQLSTGQLPFSGLNLVELSEQLLHEQPEPISRLNPSVPAEWEQIIAKCLEKNPDRRYPSALECLTAIEALERLPKSAWNSDLHPDSRDIVTILYANLPEIGKQMAAGDAKKAEALALDFSRNVEGLLKVFTEAITLRSTQETALIAFATPSDAVRFALNCPRVYRCGIHLGQVSNREASQVVEKYGVHLDTCASLMQLASAGRILMSRVVFDSARHVLSIEGEDSMDWANHGTYVFSGGGAPLEVCEVSKGGRVLEPPVNPEVGQRKVLADEEPVLGWRPAVGQRVPRTEWLLERHLGEGGFGEVWLCRHQKLDECRVFKFCFSAERLRYLRRELTLFRLLKARVGSHPGIVGIQDVCFDESPFYLVMEYSGGVDLERWCQSLGGVHKLSREVKFEIVAQLSVALQQAHDGGVIHRDIKPSNILIEGVESNPGRVRVQLTDFGIGQVMDGESLEGITRSGFTQTSDSAATDVAGSQMYLAPEIIAGKEATLRSDIYSVGVVLFQLEINDLRRPLTSEWQRNIADEILRGDLQRCFSWDPQERFSGAAQLASCLRRYPERKEERREREESRLAARRWKAIFRIGIAAVALLVLISLGLAFGLHQAQENARVVRRNQYSRDMLLAHHAWEDVNVKQTMEYLARYLPRKDEEDLRQFEWYYLWRLCSIGINAPRLELQDVPRHIQFSPVTGKHLAVAGWRQFTLWDMSAGDFEFHGNANLGPVTELDFSPDEKWIAIGRGSHVWALKVGGDEEAVRLNRGAQPGNMNSIRLLSFSRDGQELFCLDQEGEMIRWKTGDWSELARTRLPEKRSISTVAIAPDHDVLALGLDGGNIVLWNVGETVPKLKEILPFHGLIVTALAFSPTEPVLASGGVDNNVVLWDLKQSKDYQLSGHTRDIRSLAFSNDGRLLASGGDDLVVKVWDTNYLLQLGEMRGHYDSVVGLAFSPDDQTLATAGSDLTAKFWELNTHIDSSPKIIHRFTGEDGPRPATFLSGNRLVWSASDSVLTSDPESQEIVSTESMGELRSPTAIAGSDDLVAVGLNDGSILLLRPKDLSIVRTLPGHKTRVYDLAFSPDSLVLASGNHSRELRFWDVETGELVATFQEPEAAISSFDWVPGRGELVFGDGRGRISRLDPLSGEARLLTSWRAHRGPVLGIDVSPDGELIASGSSDRTVKIWRTKSSELHASPIVGHSAEIEAVRFTPDGRTLLSSGLDGRLMIWEVSDGHLRMSLKNQWRTSQIAISGDQKTVALASTTFLIRWDAASEDEVEQILMKPTPGFLREVPFVFDESVRSGEIDWGDLHQLQHTGKNQPTIEQWMPWGAYARNDEVLGCLVRGGSGDHFELSLNGVVQNPIVERQGANVSLTIENPGLGSGEVHRLELVVTGDSGKSESFHHEFRVPLLFEDFDQLPLGPAIDERIKGRKVWTKQAPRGWQIDDSRMPGHGDELNDGVTEWAGWGFPNHRWWSITTGGQSRGEFKKARGAIAVADPDEWYDLPHIASDGVSKMREFNSTLVTRAIGLGECRESSVFLRFDSSWRPENDMTAVISVSFDGGSEIELMRWESNKESVHFKDHTFSETVQLALDNPKGASEAVLMFSLVDAGNNWWWAIDNVVVDMESP